MRNKNLLLTLLLISVALISACSGVQAAPSAQETGENSEMPRTITVNGTGRISIEPDIANISIGVQTESEDAASAVEANSTQAQTIIDALTMSGIAEDDIRTTNFSVFPRQDRDRDGNIISITYVVQNTVHVTVRDLDRIGEVLNETVQAGANNITGIQFDVADRSQANAEGLDAAVKDAQARAEILAEAAGVELGDIRTINSFSAGPIFPVQRFAMETGVGGGADVPIVPGEIEVNVEVNIVYDIQ